MKYDAGMVFLANLIIACNMFAVSLDLKWADFQALLEQRVPALVGLMGQFFLLPLITFLFTLLIPVQAEMVLALILVSCMPGGNLSNVFTYVARGNVPLSMSMTALGFPLSVLLAPLSFAFYSSMHPALSNGDKAIQMDPSYMGLIILVTLLIPLVLGVCFAQRYPKLCAVLKPYIPRFTFITISVLVVIVIQANRQLLQLTDWRTPLTVVCHHSVVLLCSYYLASVFALSPPNQRTVTFEVGIQNAPLAVVLILTLMPQYSESALIVATWGGWQILACLILATYWSRKV